MRSLRKIGEGPLDLFLLQSICFTYLPSYELRRIYLPSVDQRVRSRLRSSFLLLDEGLLRFNVE